MFKNYLTIAYRNLLRYRSFALINIIGLSTGITCCVVMLIFVRYEMSFDAFHTQADKTFRIVQHTKFAEGISYWGTTAYPLAEALRNDFPEFTKVTQTSGPGKQLFSVSDNGGVNHYEEENVLFVDGSYPTVFDLNWIAGDATTALQRPNAVILTASVAKKIFTEESGNLEAILGRTIQFENKELLTVTGIIGDAPGNTNLQYDVLMNYSFYKRHNPYQSGNWSGNYQGTTFVVLSDPAQEKALEEKIRAWKKKYLKPEDDSRISYFLQPLKEIHNETRYGSSPGSYTISASILLSATTIALFILIIACANFVNLATAQASIRAKEVGIRKVLGGTRLNLIGQFAGENSLLILLTLFISIGLTQIVLAHLNTFLTILNLKLTFQPIDVFIVIFAGSIVIIMAAIYPSVVMASFRPAEALKNMTTLPSTGLGLRKSLIIFQFATVQFFIITTMIGASQMDYFLNTDQGFVSEAIVITPAPDFQKQELFREKLKQEGSIIDVAFGSGPPISVNNLMYGATFKMPHQPEEAAQKCEMKIGDLNYLEFYDLKLIAGRNFTALKHPYDEFIVNEKLVAAMGWQPEEALGKVLSINGYDAAVVGVVKDFQNTSLQDEIVPSAIMNWIYIQDVAFIKIQPDGNLKASLAHIEKTWKEFSPHKVYSFNFLDELIAKNYAVEYLVFRGFSAFTVLTILIGCLGLFGLMSFIAVKKNKEVGIRKVLGATVAQIVTMFSKQFIGLIAIAFCIAAPLAYYSMEKWLEGFANRISISWWILVSGGVVAVIIGMATISYQSIKASLANPVDSLRTE